MLLVLGGHTLSVTLRAAWEDPVVKEQHVITPLAVCATSSRFGRGEVVPDAKRQKIEELDQGKGKGQKGKNQRSVLKTGCKIRIQEGKPVCFAYSSKTECC